MEERADEVSIGQAARNKHVFWDGRPHGRKGSKRPVDDVLRLAGMARNAWLHKNLRPLSVLSPRGREPGRGGLRAEALAADEGEDDELLTWFHRLTLIQRHTVAPVNDTARSFLSEDEEKELLVAELTEVDPSNPMVMVTGVDGGGKSTLLAYIQHVHLTRLAHFNKDTALLPLLLDGALVVRAAPALLEAASASAPGDEMALASGAALALLASLSLQPYEASALRALEETDAVVRHWLKMGDGGNKGGKEEEEEEEGGEGQGEGEEGRQHDVSMADLGPEAQSWLRTARRLFRMMQAAGPVESSGESSVYLLIDHVENLGLREASRLVAYLSGMEEVAESSGRKSGSVSSLLLNWRVLLEPPQTRCGAKPYARVALAAQQQFLQMLMEYDGRRVTEQVRREKKVPSTSGAWMLVRIASVDSVEDMLTLTRLYLRAAGVSSARHAAVYQQLVRLHPSVPGFTLHLIPVVLHAQECPPDSPTRAVHGEPSTAAQSLAHHLAYVQEHCEQQGCAFETVLQIARKLSNPVNDDSSDVQSIGLEAQVGDQISSSQQEQVVKLELEDSDGEKEVAEKALNASSTTGRRGIGGSVVDGGFVAAGQFDEEEERVAQSMDGILWKRVSAEQGSWRVLGASLHQAMTAAALMQDEEQLQVALRDERHQRSEWWHMVYVYIAAQQPSFEALFPRFSGGRYATLRAYAEAVLPHAQTPAEFGQVFFSLSLRVAAAARDVAPDTRGQLGRLLTRLLEQSDAGYMHLERYPVAQQLERCIDAHSESQLHDRCFTMLSGANGLYAVSLLLSLSIPYPSSSSTSSLSSSSLSSSSTTTTTTTTPTTSSIPSTSSGVSTSPLSSTLVQQRQQQQQRIQMPFSVLRADAPARARKAALRLQWRGDFRSRLLSGQAPGLNVPMQHLGDGDSGVRAEAVAGCVAAMQHGFAQLSAARRRRLLSAGSAQWTYRTQDTRAQAQAWEPTARAAVTALQSADIRNSSAGCLHSADAGTRLITVYILAVLGGRDDDDEAAGEKAAPPSAMAPVRDKEACCEMLIHLAAEYARLPPSLLGPELAALVDETPSNQLLTLAFKLSVCLLAGPAAARSVDVEVLLVYILSAAEPRFIRKLAEVLFERLAPDVRLACLAALVRVDAQDALLMEHVLRLVRLLPSTFARASPAAAASFVRQVRSRTPSPALADMLAAVPLTERTWPALRDEPRLRPSHAEALAFDLRCRPWARLRVASRPCGARMAVRALAKALTREAAAGETQAARNLLALADLCLAARSLRLPDMHDAYSVACLLAVDVASLASSHEPIRSAMTLLSAFLRGMVVEEEEEEEEEEEDSTHVRSSMDLNRKLEHEKKDNIREGGPDEDVDSEQEKSTRARIRRKGTHGTKFCGAVLKEELWIRFFERLDEDTDPMVRGLRLAFAAVWVRVVSFRAVTPWLPTWLQRYRSRRWLLDLLGLLAPYEPRQFASQKAPFVAWVALLGDEAYSSAWLKAGWALQRLHFADHPLLVGDRFVPLLLASPDAAPQSADDSSPPSTAADREGVAIALGNAAESCLPLAHQAVALLAARLSAASSNEPAWEALERFPAASLRPMFVAAVAAASTAKDPGIRRAALGILTQVARFSASSTSSYSSPPSLEELVLAGAPAAAEVALAQSNPAVRKQALKLLRCAPHELVSDRAARLAEDVASGPAEKATVRVCALGLLLQCGRITPRNARLLGDVLDVSQPKLLVKTMALLTRLEDDVETVRALPLVAAACRSQEVRRRVLAVLGKHSAYLGALLPDEAVATLLDVLIKGDANVQRLAFRLLNAAAASADRSHARANASRLSAAFLVLLKASGPNAHRLRMDAVAALIRLPTSDRSSVLSSLLPQHSKPLVTSALVWYLLATS